MKFIIRYHCNIDGYLDYINFFFLKNHMQIIKTEMLRAITNA